MALVRELLKSDRAVRNVHEPVDCEYTVYQDYTGRKIIQLNTSGSNHRKEKGKTSQTIQFEEKSARQLADLIRREFPS